MNWHITIGDHRLAMLESVEIHKSVDLLADTCTIALPGYVHNKVLEAEGKKLEDYIKRGDAVTVKLGYGDDEALQEEFSGFVLNYPNDNGNIVIHCEDALYLMRKTVANKEFKSKTIKEIAQYLISETDAGIVLNCTHPLSYDKFVIHDAEAYDVLKKLQEESSANIYMRRLVPQGKWELNIHPPYTEHHGRVRYSFQQNIEADDLKYISKSDKKIEVLVKSTQPDGKVKEERYGTSGGALMTRDASGMSAGAMQQLAKDIHRINWTDGYEGSITTWLIPQVSPGYSAEIADEDFEYKTGWYYVNSVTTSFSENGGVRKVQLGIKTA